MTSKNSFSTTVDKSKKVILGIDPGTRCTGYGIIQGPPYEVVDFGCIRPSPSLSLHQRYLIIYHGVKQLVETFHPSDVAIETQFVHKNVQSAIKIGMARGVVLVAAGQYDIPIFEYSPRRAKMAVVGTGTASKEQVQHMVKILLGLSSPPTPEDAADGLALALCHSHHCGFETQLTKGRVEKTRKRGNTICEK